MSKANPLTVPVSMDAYLTNANAKVKLEALQDGLYGMSVNVGGKHHICVNRNDSPERQRFTICHEIGHIVLGLPSDHSAQWWTAKRPLAERLCDTFAAEAPTTGSPLSATGRRCSRLPCYHRRARGRLRGVDFFHGLALRCRCHGAMRLCPVRERQGAVCLPVEGSRRRPRVDRGKH